MPVKAGFSLDEITVKRIEVLAQGTRRDKSAIVDMAVELMSQQDEFQDLDMPQPAKKTGKINPARIHGVQKGLAA